jgi:cell wall-associated NlpC family hydrolase
MLLIWFDCRPRHRTIRLKPPLPTADGNAAMPLRRPLILAVLALAAATAAMLPTAAAHAAMTRGGWNLAEQRAVRLAGVMHDLDDQAFHGDRPLAGRQLPDALTALSTTLGAEPLHGVPASAVSVTTFDRLLVAQLGAADVAAAVQHEAWKAGLNPPPTFGTEVVARALGLRTNHPFPHEELELYPTDAITRAEAAHSFAVALKWQGTAASYARDLFSKFVLPTYTADQKRVLRGAVARIGMPYVWGGETDGAGAYFGGQEHGGYDCSGFVWRVFKLGGLPWGRLIHGRTAASQAGEIRKSARIRLDDVQPADLVFFGPGRFWQKATERRIVHEGIALSPDWMIHASAQGVYVSPLRLDPWRAKRFSWARRVL